MTKQVCSICVLYAFGALALALGQSGPEEVRLSLGKSIVIDYPTDVARISTSNADIVDASPVTTQGDPVAWQIPGHRHAGRLEQDRAAELLQHHGRPESGAVAPAAAGNLPQGRNHRLYLAGFHRAQWPVSQLRTVADRATALSALVRENDREQPPGRRRVRLKSRFCCE